MRRSLLIATLSSVSLAACADGGPPDAAGLDGSTAVDATLGADAALDATVDVDAGAGDAATIEDAAPGGDASIDGGPIRCDRPFTLDGVVYGGYAMPRTVDPAGTPTTHDVIAEPSAFVAGAMTRLTPSFAWHAQVSHLTMFDTINYAHVVRDPNDGAVYALVDQQVQSDALSFKVYGSDGALAAELVRDGAPGRDLVGRGRQSNFIVVKYDSSGAVQWVSRFGPNRAGTDRAGSAVSMGLTPTGVRVVATVEGSTQLVFGPGTPSELTYDAPGASSFWAELSKADGTYVADSFRRIESDTPTDNTARLALGYAAHAGSATAIAGFLAHDSGAPVFTVGEGGGAELTITTTTSRAFVSRLGASGAPAFLRTTFVAGAPRAAPEIRAVGLSPMGDVVAGGQFRINPGTAVFEGGGTGRLEFSSENSYLVAYSAAGDLRWVRRIDSTNRNAVSRVLVTADTVYLLGTLGRGEVLGAGEPDALSLSVTAYVLSSWALDTGALRWAVAFTDATGTSATGVLDIWTAGDRVVAPSPFTTIRLVSSRGFDVTYRPFADPAGSGAFLFDAAGELVECQAYAAGAARLKTF
ncbi:hypothetical protein L6R52_16675 [Myxococcota bacterium]|nr:hypothetical protein [Myxococcota bacterium]